ncbi:MAG: hypothetical protein NT145_08585 [Elusimicrobia bacterium]|nr:hypothetical protein [Elusimicrobiota bacterium]
MKEDKNVEGNKYPFSNGLLSELQTILEQDYGQKLSLDEVAEIGVLFVRLFDNLAQMSFKK